MEHNDHPLGEVFKNEERWVVWSMDFVGGRNTKVPYSLNGRRASSTDEATWCTYKEAKEFLKTHSNFNGVGVVFTPEKTLLGIDIDHVLNDAGEIEHEDPAIVEAIKQLIQEAKTYTEVSPSGHGLHLYLALTSPLDLDANRHAPFEAYTSGRYFTVTGNSYGEEKAVRSVSPEEATLLLEIIGYPWKNTGPSTQQQKPLEVSDEEVLRRMFASRNGTEIEALYKGNVSNHDNDESKADAALCSHLAYWTGKNAAQVERIWLASPLGARTKTQERNDYRKRTIDFALSEAGSFQAPLATRIDWEAVYSDTALASWKLSPIQAAQKLLREIPPEDRSIGYELFLRWGSLQGKSHKVAELKRTWKNVFDSEEEHREAEAKAPRSRIATCPAPNRAVSFVEWKAVIDKNFPDLRFAAETAMATVAQILIKDITNPFALILVDVPSSGKTIVINFFDGIKELTYATDKFSPASFVSNAANVSKEELAEIDLLPRIQYTMFLIRDFATLFSKREEDLKELLGILTRILDGEGLNTDSGVHGQRQYAGEYLFMLLGASTPIPPRVMKIMGNLGSRLNFLSLNSRKKTEEELAKQVADSSYKEKEKECQEATRDFLYGLWNQFPEGVVWDKKADDPAILAVVARCSKLLANLRGTINIWEDTSGFTTEYKYGIPLIEQPDRINQLFYNLARAHALVSGRTRTAESDLKAIIELCIDGAPSTRAKLFRELIEHGGTMLTSEVEEALPCSKPTALRHMTELEILGVAQKGKADKGEGEIALSEEFRWFLSEECAQLRRGE